MAGQKYDFSDFDTPAPSAGKKQLDFSDFDEDTPADVPQNVDNPQVPTTVGTGEAALRGAAQGIGGIADEAYGVVGAVANPTDSDKGIVDRYRDSRDFARGRDRAAAQQHPGAYMGAGLATGVATGALMPGVGSTMPGAAGFGAAQGLGGSEADLTKGDFAGAARDTAIGAGTGLAAQGALNAVSKVPGAVRGAKGYYDATVDALKAPANSTFDKAVNVAGAVVKRYGNGKDMARLRNSVISKMVDKGPTEGLTAPDSMLHRMSDEEFVQYGIMTGNDDVMRWVSDRAAGLHPGQLSSDEVYNALKMGSADRNAARDFAANKAQVAKDLAPHVDETMTKMDDAINSRIGTLTKQAQEGFDPSKAGNLDYWIANAKSDANSLKSIPKAVRKRLDDVTEVLETGKGPSSFKLDQGPLAQANNAEYFKRLQKVRETLDKGIDWDAIKTGKRGMTEGEEILANLRKEVDNTLKTAPGKQQADEVAKLGYEIQDAVFGKTEFKGGVDEFKLKKLFGNNDEAGRFRNNLDRLKDWANDEGYAPEARQSAKELVKKFETLYKLHDNATALGNLRYRNGPSSPAVDAFKSFHGKNSTTQDLVTATAGALNQTDEFVKQLPNAVGKSFDEMGPVEKAAAVKLRVWMNKAAQEGKVPTPESVKENFQRFLKKAQ